MTLSEKRIQFAVTLANRPLNELSPGDRMKLREGLDEYFQPKDVLALRPGDILAAEPGPSVVGDDETARFKELRRRVAATLGPSLADYDVAEFKDLQDEAKSMLDSLVKMRDGEEQIGRARAITTRECPYPINGLVGFAPLMVHGSVLDLFVRVLNHELNRWPNDRLQRCPECGNVFWRVRRQTHCTSKCYDKAYWKRYPLEKLEALREKQYAKGGWTRGARGGGKTTQQGKPIRKPKQSRKRSQRVGKAPRA